MLELKGKHCKDCKVYADTIEDDALKTIYSILECPAFANQKIRIMPDVHEGKGIVIGFSSTLGDYVNPNHVGVDIGCSMTSIVFDKKMPQSKYALFENRIKRTIPMGFNINHKKVFEDKVFFKFLNQELNKAYNSWSEMIYNNTIDEKYITNMLKRLGMDEGTFYKSIGSVGGGNHFLEYGESDDSDYGIFTIHCGSRNFGVKVCKYWSTKASQSDKVDTKEWAKALDKLKAETVDKTTLPEKIKELKASMVSACPNGYLGGNDLKGYLTDMVIAQAYAKFNHICLANTVKEIYMKTLADANNSRTKVVDEIFTTHNYINFNDHIIRKGAVQANEYQKLILPFNMRDGLAICVGKGNPDWNNTSPHGAGRIMSRSKAKESISLEDFRNSMEGIYTTCVNMSTIDEAPMVYKDTKEIIRLIEPTVEILYFVKPKINLKASE